MEEKQKNLILEKARIFSLENAQIKFQQGFSFEQVTRKNTEVENLTSEINRLSLLLKEKEQQVEALSHKNDIGKQLLNEINILDPSIKTCTYAESNIFNDTISSPQKVQVIVFKTEGRHVLNSEKKKIEGWLKSGLPSESLKIFDEF